MHIILVLITPLRSRTPARPHISITPPPRLATVPRVSRNPTIIRVFYLLDLRILLRPFRPHNSPTAVTFAISVLSSSPAPTTRVGTIRPSTPKSSMSACARKGLAAGTPFCVINAQTRFLDMLDVERHAGEHRPTLDPCPLYPSQRPDF